MLVGGHSVRLGPSDLDTPRISDVGSVESAERQLRNQTCDKKFCCRSDYAAWTVADSFQTFVGP